MRSSIKVLKLADSYFEVSKYTFLSSKLIYEYLITIFTIYLKGPKGVAGAQGFPGKYIVKASSEFTQALQIT